MVERRSCPSYLHPTVEFHAKMVLGPVTFLSLSSCTGSAFPAEMSFSSSSWDHTDSTVIPHHRVLFCSSTLLGRRNLSSWRTEVQPSFRLGFSNATEGLRWAGPDWARWMLQGMVQSKYYWYYNTSNSSNFHIAHTWNSKTILVCHCYFQGSLSCQGIDFMSCQDIDFMTHLKKKRIKKKISTVGGKIWNNLDV